ncbi:GntR family transcriptional regulator [Chakrabartyella piscis]|uniref:GntR family transcriptional regulator n=1 Tax=Chakrabartyella piscis TaxID=2918914 RepID=UPI002958444A|nr:GntR family transcriptional regulator [Chakrabartyella piscis]
MKKQKSTKKILNQETLEQLQADNPFVPLNDIIYEELFQQIIQFRLLPNEKINEAKIAKDLGISRSPVHMAVSRLMEEKLVTKEAGKAPTVAPFYLADCLHLMRARTLLESEAGFLATSNMDGEQLAQLRALATQIEGLATDEHAEGFEFCDYEFHNLIVGCCGNPYILEMYEKIQPRLLYFRFYLRYHFGDDLLRLSVKEAVNSHRAICNAIELGLPTLVKDELSRHIDASKDMFMKWR